MMKKHALLPLALLLLAPALLSAQAGATGGAFQMTRADLQAALQQAEQAAVAPGYSEKLRERASAEAARIRQRLQEGDLRPGDKVALLVERYQALTDTFTVTLARELVLPEIGNVGLDGVLRSELEEHLREHIGRFVRDPRVRATALVRLEFAGAVQRVGYYTMPTEILLTDALMMVGGPAGNAVPEKMRIERSGTTVWEGEQLQVAITEGRTLDQLSLQAGDRIVMPQRRNTFESIRTVLMVVSGIASAVLLADRLGAF